MRPDFDDVPGLQAVLLDDVASVRRGSATWSVAWPRRSGCFTRSTPWSSPYDPRQPCRQLHQPRLQLPDLQHNWRHTTAHGPPAPDTSGAVSEVAPWPNYLTVEGLRNVAGTHNVDRQDPPVVHVLPGDTQEMVAACSSSALPLHVRIPDRLKAKIWAGEYVDLALLLHDNFAQPQDDALSVQSAGDGQGPTLCLSCVVGILLHVLYCYVEMWALGALCPGGFV